MDGVSIVGVDLAKQVFQVHGAAADGRVLFRKSWRVWMPPVWQAYSSVCAFNRL